MLLPLSLLPSHTQEEAPYFCLFRKLPKLLYDFGISGSWTTNMICLVGNNLLVVQLMQYDGKYPTNTPKGDEKCNMPNHDSTDHKIDGIYTKFV